MTLYSMLVQRAGARQLGRTELVLPIEYVVNDDERKFMRVMACILMLRLKSRLRICYSRGTVGKGN